MRIHLKQGYKHPHYTTTRKAVKKSKTLLMPSRNDREISGRINYVLGRVVYICNDFLKCLHVICFIS